MTKQKIPEERDELRARFTVWLDKLLHRAKLNYLKKMSVPAEIVSFDDLHEENLPYIEDEWMDSLFQGDGFNFEEKRLAKAYAELPLMRREILRLLFVEELKTSEIARRLNCSPKYVTNQRSKGLRYLRIALSGGGDEDE